MRVLLLLSAPAVVLGFGQGSATACQWESDGTLSFTIDPATTPGPILAVVSQPAVKCGTGESFSVQAASTNTSGPMAFCPITGSLSNGNGQTIAYTLSCIAGGVGQGISAADPAVVLGIAGKIEVADFQNAAGGSGYSDRITLQVTY